MLPAPPPPPKKKKKKKKLQKTNKKQKQQQQQKTNKQTKTKKQRQTNKKPTRAKKKKQRQKRNNKKKTPAIKQTIKISLFNVSQYIILILPRKTQTIRFHRLRPLLVSFFFTNKASCPPAPQSVAILCLIKAANRVETKTNKDGETQQYIIYSKDLSLSFYSFYG